jgi:DNA replication and repair protein RecF
LINFRNFAELDLDLPLGVVVFTGANAQGKTTLLEAAYLLAIARSFRAENERELISFRAGLNGEQALVRGIVERKDRRLSVNVGYQSTASPGPVPSMADGLGYSVRKQIRVNRTHCTAAGLVGMVGAVLFSADDIELVYGAPSGRRRYLDILISQADPPYVKALQRYQRVLQQRNHLLKMLREGRAEADELEFWNAELVREGSGITWQRQEVMRRLAVFCAEHHNQLSENIGDFQIEYRPNVVGGDSRSSTEERFRESLAAFHQRELATATTVVGPHRDDFRLLVSGVDMGTFASRGEARTLALTLRLSEASYLSAARNDEPVVLLDDVLSEMDVARRRRVLEKVTCYQQSLITTTDLALVRDYLGDQATYFTVADGLVLPYAEENPAPRTG